jgi:hypothetical protein
VEAGADGVWPFRTAVRNQVAVDKSEGHQKPDGAPAQGDGGSAHDVLDGEARDNVLKNFIRKAADVVYTVRDPQYGGEGHSGVEGDRWKRPRGR